MVHATAQPQIAREPQPAPEQKPRKKKGRVVVARGKRKEAVARATLQEGAGRISVNGASIFSSQNPLSREVVSEPLRFADTSKLDIAVNAHGGGFAGQAQAARTAIAKGLVAWTKDSKMRATMMQHDRSLLVEDPRRVEPKKFKGPKARARFTKSYR